MKVKNADCNVRSLQVTSFEDALPFLLLYLLSPFAFLQLMHEGELHFEMKNNLCHKRRIPLSLRGFAH